MVYKKYIKKDGKLYGPYIYQSKRVDGKVVSKYLGVSDSKDQNNLNKNKIILFLFIFFITAFIFSYSLFFNKSFTGKVTLENKDININESKLSLSLSLKEGELIPQYSNLVLESSNQIKKYPLKDLILKNFSSSGIFYIENVNLSENGEGFGIDGKKVIYPNLTFKFLIKKSLNNNLSAQESSSSEENVFTNNSSNLINFNNQSTESITTNVNESTILQSDTTPQQSNTTSSNSVLETSLENDSSQEQDSKVDISTTSDSTSLEEKANTSSESSSILESIQNAVSNLFLILTPTGRVIESSSNDFYQIQGNVSKNNPFIYKLNPGETFEIVSGSVKDKSVGLEDNLLLIKQEGDLMIIETNYSTEEEGFGKDYLGEVYKIPLEIKNLFQDINPPENEDFKIYLEYNNQTISSVKDIYSSSTESINLPVEEMPILNFNETQNQTFFNQTQNLSEGVLENLSLNNFSLSKLFLTENEKQLFLSKFSNDSLKIIKSELFNERYVIGYQLADYYIEYSYDSNLSEDILKSLIENDKIKWIKDILSKEFNQEINSQPVSENIKNLINSSII